MQIKLQFIQSYSTETLEKTFYSKQILDKYKKTPFVQIQKLNSLLIGQSDRINFYERLF